jgi:acyl-CoA thioester hydrolase
MREVIPDLHQFPWVTEHDLRFADMDPIGHVNHGTFLSLVESSRSALLFGDEVPRAGKLQFVLARLEIDYRRELHWPGRVNSATGVERIGTTSLGLRQAVFTDLDCAAVVRAVIVAVDREAHRPVPIPPSTRDALERWRMLA